MISCLAAMQARSELVAYRYEPDPLKSWEVEVSITHCGICHSDLHLIDDDWGLSVFPLVPGHEIIGTVTARGDAVGRLQPGQRVGIGWQCGCCMECAHCQAGDENLCASGQPTCVGRPGGFADAIRIDSRFAFPIPDSLPSEAAAPLLCGGITTYAPLRHYDVKPHMRVGVIGIGGLGHLALQFASAYGCEVTAFSHTPEKEKDARALGASHFVSTADPKNLEAVAGSLDFILSTVMVDIDWSAYLKILEPRGKLIVVGATSQPMQIPGLALLMGLKLVGGSPIGGRRMIAEMLDFAARHGIGARSEVVPMREANAALQRVRANRARYRVVLRNG